MLTLKNKKKYTALVFPFAIALALMFVSQFKHADKELSCDEAPFDFGQIPNVNGEVVAKHVFTIRNNTAHEIKIRAVGSSCPLCFTIDDFDTVIPARGIGKIATTMKLPVSSFAGKTVEMRVAPEEKTIETLSIPISARSALSTYFEKSSISFKSIYRNDYKKQTEDFYIFCASKKKEDKFVESIWTDKPDLVTLSMEEESSELVKGGLSDFYFHRRRLFASLLVTKKMPIGLHSATVFVSTRTGGVNKATITWNLVDKPVFDPEEFRIVDTKNNEKQTFSLIYNVNVGGRPKSYRSSSRNIEIVKTECYEDCVFITFQYLPDAKNLILNQVLGEVIVETEDGKEHRLKVVAS
jgi:hypothetical protein